jgi:hypothetical protein
MIKFIHKKLDRKYKKEELVKRHNEQKLSDNVDYNTTIKGGSCGLGR